MEGAEGVVLQAPTGWCVGHDSTGSLARGAPGNGCKMLQNVQPHCDTMMHPPDGQQ